MRYIFFFLFSVGATTLFAQTSTYAPNNLVNFDDYLKLVQEVKPYRETRLISLIKYNELVSMKDVIVLDTRSDSMYKAKHIKGAIHLCFSDFTEANLRRLIPSFHTRIIIYCNNNFMDDELYFPKKSATPNLTNKLGGDEKALTLALNIPTFINLYGYGYKDIYELNELISVRNMNIQFEGTEVSLLEY